MHYSCVFQQKFVTTDNLPVLTTLLFGSIFFFLLSAYLDLSEACAKIVEPLCCLKAWMGLTLP